MLFIKEREERRVSISGIKIRKLYYRFFRCWNDRRKSSQVIVKVYGHLHCFWKCVWNGGFHEKQWGTETTSVGSVGMLNWKRKCIYKKTKTAETVWESGGRDGGGCLFHLEVPRILIHSPWFCWLPLGDKADDGGAHGGSHSCSTCEEAENKEGSGDQERPSNVNQVPTPEAPNLQK